MDDASRHRFSAQLADARSAFQRANPTLRRHFFLAGTALLIAALLIASGGRLLVTKLFPKEQGDPAASARATPVHAITPQMRTFTDRIDVLGAAKGIRSVNITSNTLELVTRVRFRDGQMVRAGDALIELKAREQNADIAEARAALDVARTNYNRYQRLAEQGFLSPAAMDQYRATHRQAEANLAAATSRAQDRVIRAPFAGRVGLTDVAPGALISPGITIATLDDISRMRVDFEVPDRYLPVLRAGLLIVARPDAYPDRLVEGRIAAVDTRIDPNTHAIRARAEFSNRDGLIVPGMLMHVAIENGRRQALAVPEAAVLVESDQSFVAVIERNGGHPSARLIPVEIGLNDRGTLEIKSGLAAGVQIVADGVNRLPVDGPVRILAGRTGGNDDASIAKTR